MSIHNVHKYIHNFDEAPSCLQAAFGQRISFKNFKYIGYHVWCRPTGELDTKFKSNSYEEHLLL